MKQAKYYLIIGLVALVAVAIASRIPKAKSLVLGM